MKPTCYFLCFLTLCLLVPGNLLPDGEVDFVVRSVLIALALTGLACLWRMK